MARPIRTRQLARAIAATTPNFELDNVRGRIHRALRDQADDVKEAVRLYAEWTGETVYRDEIPMIAHYIGCGLSPSRAASRRWGYVLYRRLHRTMGRTLNKGHACPPIGL